MAVTFFSFLGNLKEQSVHMAAGKSWFSVVNSGIACLMAATFIF
jgi:hypothetical protein